MAAITDPLAAAAIVFCLGAAANRLFQPEGQDADEMPARMVFRLMLGPACLAVLILILSGTADHLYLLR
jgi:hypothetical protein